jgi:fatty acid desaturase
MSAEHRQIPEPGELVYAPRPSWAPAFFAFAAALAVCGIFAGGFMFPPWVYSIVGVVVMIFALRAMVRGAVRDYFRRPRRQRARGGVLPVETISPPRP